MSGFDLACLILGKITLVALGIGMTITLVIWLLNRRDEYNKLLRTVEGLDKRLIILDKRDDQSLLRMNRIEDDIRSLKYDNAEPLKK